MGECALWARLTGPRFAAQVAAAVSLVEAPANHRKATTVAKEVMAIKYSNNTSLSIEKFLEAPFAGKHPKLIKKGTKAQTRAQRSAVCAWAPSQLCSARLGWTQLFGKWLSHILGIGAVS